MQNIIIAGLGFMGTMHAQAYSQIRNARVAAVVDSRRFHAMRRLQSLGIHAPVFASLAEALEAVPDAAVDICLPTDLHVAFAMDAIKAGRHVFCEKPLALREKDGRRLAAAARDAGVFFQVGHCIRFWPEYQALEAFVRSNRGGRLLSLSLFRRAGRPTYSTGDWLNDHQRSGGGALDLHIHDTDFVHHLLGKPAAVTSVGTKDETGWSHIFTTYKFNDVAVTAEGGWNYPPAWGFQMGFQAVFEDATIDFDSSGNPTMRLTRGGARKRPMPFAAPKAGDSKAANGNLASLGGYFNELAAFLRCLKHGRPPQTATADQAADSLATTLAEIKSAAAGKTITL